MSKKPSSLPRSVPKTGFVDTMAASQQTHINELVQQNQNLQDALKRLRDQFSKEQDRSREAARNIQEQWRKERLEWQEGCDTLRACHQLEYLRLTKDLQAESQNVVEQKKLLRWEKVARAQRDFKLTMFQAREQELERQVEELQAEIKDWKDSATAQDGARTAALKQVKAEFAEYVAQAQSESQRFADVEEEKDRLQEELGKLREERATLQVSNDSLATRLERAQLHLDGSKRSADEFQQKNDELNRTVADLKRQLDQWQDLEIRGGAEAEFHRKKCVELEIRIGHLEGQLEQADKRTGEPSAALEKEQRKNIKLKEREQAEAFQDEVETLKARISLLETENESLQADLQTERAISRPARARTQSKDAPIAQPEEGEEEEESPPPPPTRKPASTKKGPSSSKAGKTTAKPASKAQRLVPVVEIEAGPSTPTRPTLPPVSSGSSADDADEIVELAIPGPSGEEPEFEAKDKPKTKAHTESTTKKGKRKVANDSVEEEESEIEISEVPKPGLSKKAKGKAKATADNSDVEEVTPPQKPAKAKPASKSNTTTRPRKRKAASPEPAIELDESKSKKKPASTRAKKPAKEKPARSPSPEVEPPPENLPKKKRKINIFPPTQGSFNILGDTLGGGLGIPTDLSPIKDTEAVPSRSLSTANGLRSRIAESFAWRR
ncbi:hypothetical protein ONZ45_g10655 [Pleurotus djamor]|nr:hypothetical protein ONZ45_g10655 [Pleurotus djamor]